MDQTEQLLNELREAGREYAHARSQYEYLENYKKHLIARLMKDAEANGSKTVAAQEREAYASSVYVGHIEGLREAQAVSANAHSKLRLAEMAIELWRTQQANERLERRAYSA